MAGKLLKLIRLLGARMINETSLNRTIKVIKSRKNADKSNSYVASLLQGSEEKILKKLTEETTELILAVNSPNVGNGS